MGDGKYASKGIIHGIINNLINVLLPFISRTIIIYKLGTNYVGLGSLFNSILQVLSLSELGVGAAISYTLYKPLVDKDKDKVDAILKFYKLVYLMIGGAILLFSIALFPFLGYLIKSDVPDGINIRILYVIYVLNTVESYLFWGYKKVLLSANKRYDIEVRINSIITVLQYLTQIVLLLLFSNYYLFAIAVPIATLANNLYSYIRVNREFPGYICKGSLSKAEIQDILKITFGSFFAKIGSTIYLTADNIVISAFLGLTILGIYNNYYYILGALIAVFAVVHNTMRPIIGQEIIRENREECWKRFKVFNTIYMSAVIFCCSCCLALFQDFELCWCGSDNMLSFSIVILMVIYFYSGRSYSTLNLYQEAAGLMWKGKFVPLFSAILNLVTNIILVHFIGLYGILISSILASVLISFPGYIYIIFGSLFNKENRKKYLFDSLLFIVELMVVCCATYFISYKLKAQNWGFFALKLLLVAAISMGMVMLCNIKNKSFFDGCKLVIAKIKKKR